MGSPGRIYSIFTAFKGASTALAGAFLAANAWAADYKFYSIESRVLTPAECAQFLDTPGPVRLQDKKKVLTYQRNFENVMEYRGKHEYAGVNPETGKYQYKPSNAQPNRTMDDWKFSAKQKGIIDAGKIMGLGENVLPDFIIGSEIENLKMGNVLFNTGPLSGKYRVFLAEGNDSRGIDIAFAILAELAVRVKMETHRHVEWDDLIEQKRVRLFSRDFPVLIVTDSATGRPLQILMGNHAKSKRHRDGPGGKDEESFLLRKAQYQAMAQIIRSYIARFPGVPIFMAGDFNTDIRFGKEVEEIKTLLKVSLSIVNATNFVTQSYFPPNGPPVRSQLDGILVSPDAGTHVIAAQVLPDFDRVTGEPLGEPKTYNDRTQNYPSDHHGQAMVTDGAVYADPK